MPFPSFNGKTNDNFCKHQQKIIRIKFLYYICLLTVYRQDQHPNVVFKRRVYVAFLKVIIIDWYNSSANCWFHIIWLLIAPPEVLSAGGFLSKNL